MKHEGHFDALLILRGLAILAVLLYHMQYPGVLMPAIFSVDIHWITTSSGMAAVWILLILSGYLIGKGFYTKKYPLTTKGISKFYIKRFFRVAPLYYGLIFIMAFVLRLWLTDKNSAYLFQLLTFTATNLFYRADVNYLWVLSTEMQWYLISPLVFFTIWAVLRKLKNTYATVLLVFLFLLFHTTYQHISFTNTPPLFDWQFLRDTVTTFRFNLIFFLFGLCLNFIVFPEGIGIQTKQTHARSPFLKQSVLIFGIGGLYILSAYIQYMLRIDFSSYVYFAGIILPLILMVVIGCVIYFVERPVYINPHDNTVTAKKRRNLNPLLLLQGFGIISYEAYLFHMPVITSFGLSCNDGKIFYCTTSVFIERFILLVIMSALFGFLSSSLVYTIIPKIITICRKPKSTHT